MKSNPHVYPFLPFQDLSQKDIFPITDSISVTTKHISDLITSLDRLTDEHIPVDGNVTDKILNLLAHDEIRFGPQDFITDSYEDRISDIEHFTSQELPIQCTILGFPFKIPVPLKTNRTLPDLGELLSLHRLYRIGQLIQNIYHPGCRITIFSEGAFASAVGVYLQDAERYHVYLEYLIDTFGYGEILKARRLSDMESTVSNFPELYQTKVQELKDLYDQGDEHYLNKYTGTYGAVSKIVSTTDIDIQLLMDAYNPDLNDTDLSAEVLTIRTDIQQRTHEAIFLYHAYLMTRDTIQFLETITPNALRMSVSPKANRYGVQPINSSCDKLAYHSVPVIDASTQDISQEYLIDILRDSVSTYTKVHWTQDKESVPFYYLKHAR